MDYLNKIITDIELHNVAGIRECFENGIDPNEVFRGESLINELISEYTRSPRFKECVKAFVDHGLQMEDKNLLAVLLDDKQMLENILKKDHALINKTYSFRCAYTPFHEVNLLHICAEFNHVSCAEILVRYGVDVNSQADIDDNGFGGQTPIFHTVNQNSNASNEMLEFLLNNEADLKITVPGLIWGKGYDWETFIPSVNPISYAMMGLLPQMHRNETVVSEVVSKLMKACFNINYTPPNVPIKYLRKE